MSALPKLVPADLVPDLEQAERFLTLLDEEAEAFTFQTFTDGKPKPDPDPLADVRHGCLEAWADWLTAMNQAGAGVFVTINETDGTGRRKENITRIRAVWQECDRGDEPGLPLDPHIIVESSPGKHHRYVLVDGATLDEFEPVQRRLVDDYGSDPNAKDRSRVLRLPGFYHLKDSAHPHLVRLVHESGSQPLPWSDAIRHFPPVPIDNRDNVHRLPAEGTPLVNAAEIRSALDVLDPDMGFSGWLRIGMALQSTGAGLEAFHLWDGWSAKGALYKAGECAYRWQTFGRSRRNLVTIGSLFYEAQRSGWVNPAAGTGGMKKGDQVPQAGDAIMRPISARALFAMNFGEMVWNIQDILPAGTTLLFGKPKKGKSFLALNIAISIAAARPVFGQASSGCRVLYLGLEDSTRRLQRRAKGCAASLGIDPDEFADRLHLDTKSARIDTGLLDELHDWMKAYPDTGVIVLDMLKKVTGAATGKSLYDEQSKVGDALTAFCHDYPALSIIVVHHSRKAESDDPFDLVSGTTGLSGSYDSLAALADTEGVRVLHLTGRDIEGAEIPLLMNDRGMYTLAMPDSDEARTANMSDTRRRVFDAVPASISQERSKLVEDAGLDGRVVDQQLRKLKRDGLIKLVGRGQYQKTGKRWFDDPVVDFDAVIQNAGRL